MMGSFVMMPNVDAQGRRGGSESSRSSQQVSNSRSGRDNDKKAIRPGSSSVGSNSSKPSKDFASKPSKPGNGPDKGSKPSKPGNGPDKGSKPSKPGNGPDKNHKPSKPDQGPSPKTNHGPDHKPGGSSHPGPDHKPGHSPDHGPAHKPGQGPGHDPHYKPGHRPPTVAPPPRPGRPIYHDPWARPVPPSHWHPVNKTYLVPNVLGLTFGMAINSALDYLWYEGFVIDGYGTNEVYLRNVYEMGYYWDEATMYFVGNGLSRSQFYDSTSYYDTSRFNNVYNSLCAKYGNPVSRNGMSATWFGYYGDYVTLEYTQMNSSSGYRYFTILTYGR